MIGFSQMKNSKSKYLAITGATGYLGTHLAEHFSSQGLNLFLVARNKKNLADLKKNLLSRYKIQIRTHEIDFSKFNKESVLDRIDSEIMLSGMIHTVGDQKPIGPLMTQNMECIRSSIEVNFMSAILVSKFFISRSEASRNSSIIFISGGGATFPRADFAAYGSAKAALIRMVETLSFELKHLSISVNAISPGNLPSMMMNEIIDFRNQVSADEVATAQNTLQVDDVNLSKVIELCDFLLTESGNKITGKLISPKWDNWKNWLQHLNELQESDLYTLRRITAKDRGHNWGDL
jgi:3-oxoacyl-[acyl-carrier protein] reductase